MDILIALVALGAFAYAVRGYDLQMKTTKAVKKHLDETARAEGQENGGP